MRHERAHGHGPQAWGHIVVGQGQPVVQAALRVGLHDFQNFGFAFESVRFELRNASAGVKGLAPHIAQHIAMRGQNEFDVVLFAGSQEFVE